MSFILDADDDTVNPAVVDGLQHGTATWANQQPFLRNDGGDIIMFYKFKGKVLNKLLFYFIIDKLS